MLNTSTEYCIYLRKSRTDIEAEASGEGETLARHEKILLDLGRKLKLNITKIYKEVVSGETISSRPVMQELLSSVEQGLWQGVLVVEVERLARGDTMDQGMVSQTFKYSNTKIITPMKTYDPNNEFDEEYFEFGLFMSRREYKTINRRLQRGRLESVKEGKYVGNKPPYGYVRKKLEKEKGYTLEPHSEQADIVKLIFQLYTKGEQQSSGDYKRLGVSLIVRKLNELKIPTVNGGDWVPSTVRDILSNPVYIGKIRWNSRPQVKKMIDGRMVKERPRAKEKDMILVDGLHKAIIDNNTFNLAQEYLASNPALPVPTRHVVKNPLAGIVICGKCNRRMNRRPYGGKYPDTLMCPVTSCDNVSSHLHLVEDKLLQTLEEWLENYKLSLESEEIESQSNVELDLIKKTIEKLDDELNTLEKQMENIHDLLEQGIYSTEKFLERSKVISEKTSSAQNDKDKLLETLRLESTKEKGKKVIIPKIERVLKLYNLVKTPAEKNELLKEVIDKVVYIKEVRGRWHGKPDDFELILYPKLND